MKMRYQDPVSGEFLEMRLVKASDLTNGQFQRPLSKTLVNKLHVSVGTGFLVPVICVHVNGQLEVIDGQHRLQALIDARGPDVAVPVIVVPEKWRYNPLLLNIEKGDNIKDKCHKVHALYMHYLETSPEAIERDLIAPAIEPHLPTLAIAHVEQTLSSPSLVETLVKKLDSYLDMPMTQAIEERRRRAEKVCEVERLVLELDIRDFNLRKAVISQTTMKLWGRKRMITTPFDEGMDAVIDTIIATDWSYLEGR